MIIHMFFCTPRPSRNTNVLFFSSEATTTERGGGQKRIASMRARARTRDRCPNEFCIPAMDTAPTSRERAPLETSLAHRRHRTTTLNIQFLTDVPNDAKAIFNASNAVIKYRILLCVL